MGDIITITIQIEADDELTREVAEELRASFEELVAMKSFSLYDSEVEYEED
jgi:hypothetical protein